MSGTFVGQLHVRRPAAILARTPSRALPSPPTPDDLLEWFDRDHRDDIRQTISATRRR